MQGIRWTRLCPQCRKVLEKKTLEQNLTCQCGWVWRGSEEVSKR